MRNYILFLLIFILSYSVFSQNWEFQEEITDENASGTTKFGHTVAIDNNCAIVSASSISNPEFRSGAIYFYEIINDTWTNTLKITPEDVEANSNIGHSVDIYGDYAIASNVNDSISTGAAYIFYKNTNWEIEQKIKPQSLTSGDHFGASVGIYNNFALISADDANNGSGCVYLYCLINNTWQQIKKISSPSGIANSHFGHSISITKNYFVVGAYQDTNYIDSCKTGAAYIYKYETDTCFIIDTLVGTNDNGKFGYSLDISPQNLIIGDYSIAPNSCAHIYTNNNNKWVEQLKYTIEDTLSNDNCGESVAIKGDYALISYNIPYSDISKGYLFKKTSNIWAFYQQIFNPLPQTEPAGDQYLDITDNYAIIGNSTNNAYGSFRGSAQIWQFKRTDLIENIDISNVEFYPNPTSNFCQINANILIKKIELYTINGQLLHKYLPKSDKFKLNLSNYESGVYFIKIETKNSVICKRIIKN